MTHALFVGVLIYCEVVSHNILLADLGVVPGLD